MIAIGFVLGCIFMGVLRWVLFRLNKKAVQHSIEKIENDLKSL